MAQTLQIPNYGSLNIINGSQTQLTAATASGVNSLPVQDVDDFATSGYVLIGTKGAGTSELLQAGTISGATTIPLTTNTAQAHNQFDPVYPLFGNQINVYRATDAGLGQQPADASFSLIATVAIDYSEATTSYTDPLGGGGYWYKFTYFNSTNSGETDIGSATAVRGSFTVSYCSLDEIRRQAGFANSPFVIDDQIDEKRQAAQDEINGALDEFYETPLQPPINDFLKQICIRLSAGLLRQAQYSAISDPQVNGTNMYNAAQTDLKRLILKERVLTNKQGQPLDSTGATGGIEGWPNSSTRSTPKYEGGAPRVFRMGDIQGQPLSQDSSGNPVGNLYYGRKW